MDEVIMNITRIARFLSAQNEPARTQTPANQTDESALPQNNEAVTVGGNLSSDAADSQSARADKLASLKERVSNGSYFRDSREVASALYKELFI